MASQAQPLERAMNLPDVNRLAGEVVSRDDFGIQARAPEYRQRESSQSNNNAAAALEVVSELAAAIRELEEQPAQAVARAGDRANSIAKQLESEKAKAARAEAAAQELSAALARTRSDLEITRRQLANKSEQLSQTEDRLRLADAEARAAQQRRMEANAKSEQIVEAIRTQLRSRKNLPAPN
jgi:chromosome segregation ATPase